MRLRSPVQGIHGCLTFGVDGAVWATYKMPGLPTLHRDDTARLNIHRRVANALMTACAQGKEFVLLGIAEPVDPDDVAEAMLGGVNTAAAPNWPPLVEATVKAGEEVQELRRTVFLSVKLADPGGWKAVSTALRAAEDMIGADLGLTAGPIPKRDRERRSAEAKALARRLAANLREAVEPVSASTVEWLHTRAYLRGIDDVPAPRRHAQGVTRAQVVSIADRTKIFEGGQKGDLGRKAWGNHEYAKVVTVLEDGRLAEGYQTAAVVSSHPERWDHPGGSGEWAARLDEIGPEMDWCIRVKVDSAEHALAKIRRKRYEAAAQVGEHDDAAIGSSLAKSGAAAVHALNDQETYLKEHPGESDLSVTTIIALSADSLAGLAEDFHAVADHFRVDGYTFDRPVGHQCALLACMQPGSPPHGVLGHFGQSMFCTALASASPLEAGELMDPYGMLIADRWDGAERCGPLFTDLAYGPRSDRGSSMAFVGDQGGGKSYAGKNITFGTLARGGKAVVLDRTQIEEYIRFSEVVPHLLPGVVTQRVRLDDPRICVDPMQMFTPDPDTGEDLRRKYTLGLACTMLNIETMSGQYTALARAVDQVLRGPDPQMRYVLEAISAEARSASTPEGRRAAADVADKLTALAVEPLGRLIFGDGELLDLSRVDYIVFAARNLDLPTEKQLSTPHLYNKLPPEKILAQGLIYLITAISREFAFADKRMCVCTFDEVWALTNSAEGQALLEDIIRNGRKHNASVIVLSQDAADLSRLTGISYWFVFLLVNEDAVRRALKCAGLPATDEEVEMITDTEQMQNGVCLARDLSRRAGVIRFREALASTPIRTTQLRLSLETNRDKIVPVEEILALGAATATGGTRRPVKPTTRPRTPAAAPATAPSAAASAKADPPRPRAPADQTQRPRVPAAAAAAAVTGGVGVGTALMRPSERRRLAQRDQGREEAS